MLENAVNSGVWLTFASLAVAVFTLTILVLIYLLLREAIAIRIAENIVRQPAAPVTSSAAAVVAAKKAEAALKPGRSCGHCGVRIKGDPVRGIALEQQGYLVYVCPDCKKETLLPQ